MNAQENKVKIKLLKEAGENLQGALDKLWKVYEMQSTQELYHNTNAMTEIVNIRNTIRLPHVCIERLVKHFEKGLKI